MYFVRYPKPPEQKSPEVEKLDDELTKIKARLPKLWQEIEDAKVSRASCPLCMRIFALTTVLISRQR